MAAPSSQIVTPRDDLGLFYEAIDLAAIRDGYIGFQIAPIIEARFKRGQFSFRDIKQVLKKTSTERDQDGRFNRVKSDFGRKDYRVKTHGLEELVDHDEEAENLGMIDSEMVAADVTRHGCLENHELRVIEKVNSVTAAETLGAYDKWTNDASDPVTQVVKWKRAFKLNCGFQPNALVIDETALDVLASHPAVVEAAGRVGSNHQEALEFNDVSRELRRRAVAAALGIAEIIESKGVHNTAGEPLEAQLATTFPETKAVLLRRGTGRTTRDMQWLRTVHWSANGSRPGCAFEMYEEPQTDGTVIRHRLDTEIIEVNAECVMVIDGIIDIAFFTG